MTQSAAMLSTIRQGTTVGISHNQTAESRELSRRRLEQMEIPGYPDVKF